MLKSPHFVRDNLLREFVAKILHQRNFDGVDNISSNGFADAKMGDLYVVYDNGHMNDDQLREKLKHHHSGRGSSVFCSLWDIDLGKLILSRSV